MPLSLTGYRVFIASPSGLEAERQAFHEVFQEQNDLFEVQRGIQFIPVSWQDMPGGFGRPQSIINESIRECDYFVLVLWDRWGSSPHPHAQGTFSSATEEEYNLALECFSDPQRPLRQIVVLFKAVDPRKLEDPGEQLQKVLAFKRALEDKKECLFTTFDDLDAFRRRLRKHLSDWTYQHEQGTALKASTTASIPEAVGRVSRLELIPKQLNRNLVGIVAQLLQRAEALTSQGKLTDAEALLARAITRYNDPASFHAYGKFLIRNGRFAQARVMYDRLLDLGDVAEGTWKVIAYSKLGRIHRKRCELDQAENMYLKALELSTDLNYLEGKADSLGALGLLSQLRGDYTRAEQLHREALNLDEKAKHLPGMVAQYDDLGLIYEEQGDLDTAEQMYMKAFDIERDLSNKEGVATQHCNLGVIQLLRGNLDIAEQLLMKSLQANKDLGCEEGVAIAQGYLGMVYIRRGELDTAEQFIMHSLETEQRLDRKQGVARNYESLGRVYELKGSWSAAYSILVKARDLYIAIGMPHRAKQVEHALKSLTNAAPLAS